MKTKNLFPIITVLLLIGFSACNLGGESNFSPRLILLNPAKLNSDSTLYMSNSEDGNIKFDSLMVNDTITISLIGEGFANNLIKLSISVKDETDIEILAPHDSVASYFSKKSDFVNGIILCDENVVWMNYPFQFVAVKPKDKVKIHFQLESDAKEVTNTSNILLEFPIKPKS